MAVLNDRHIKILRVIDAGNITGEDIAAAVGSSMQLLSYYLNTLSDDGYLKIAKVYDNFTREFQIVRAYLTSEGKQALAQANANSAGASGIAPSTPSTTEAAHPTVHPTAHPTAATPAHTATIAPDAPSGNDPTVHSSGLESGLNYNTPDYNTPDYNTPDYNTLAQHIVALTQVLEALPPNRRDLVTVYLEDLAIEVNQPDKRRSNRLKAYFLAILNTVVPILKHLPESEQFTHLTQAIAQQLQLPIKFPD
ncbi:hypothetical protein [Alkalinema sp. FACHB-956]|uniref:hypothetical protein n=1 Tax=Alkalinema sp. FACHB-956 TaxID=2692768 RepID=UPI001686AE34|nr:hypothetical protein [Alkalinema sp. FACHB-956]MBD2329313.1 hypothetical protein [Alkalinema sp. FACHB-956]